MGSLRLAWRRICTVLTLIGNGAFTFKSGAVPVRHIVESLTGLITAPASYLGLHFDFDFDVSKPALSPIKPRTCASVVQSYRAEVLLSLHSRRVCSK